MRPARDEEFRAYVEANRPTLMRTATLLAAGDSYLAEDLVQTCLTRLYVAWPRVRHGQDAHRYACRILANAFTDEVRRPRWRRERAYGDVPDAPVEPGATADDAAEVRRCLAALPPGMRAAVVLRHWLELDVAETARALGCSEGTVKSQTARGLDRMRALLGPLDADPLSAPTHPTSTGRPAP